MEAGQQHSASSTGDLGEDLAAVVEREVERVMATVRDDLEQLREEAATRGRELASGTAQLGAAGGLAFVAAGALLTLPLLALRRVLPAWTIALLVAGGAGAGAGVLGARGLRRLSVAAPDGVRDRAAEVAADVKRTVRERARAATTA